MTGTQFELSNNSRSDHEIAVNNNNNAGPMWGIWGGLIHRSSLYFVKLLLLIPVCSHVQLEQLYSLSLCSREDCLRVLSKYQWNLQMASRYLIRWSRDERPPPVDRERPQVIAERRVWSSAGWFWMHGWLTAAQTADYAWKWEESGECERRKMKIALWKTFNRVKRFLKGFFFFFYIFNKTSSNTGSVCK